MALKYKILGCNQTLRHYKGNRFDALHVLLLAFMGWYGTNCNMIFIIMGLNNLNHHLAPSNVSRLIDMTTNFCIFSYFNLFLFGIYGRMISCICVYFITTNYYRFTKGDITDIEFMNFYCFYGQIVTLMSVSVSLSCDWY
jgi:hypothetical protein